MNVKASRRGDDKVSQVVSKQFNLHRELFSTSVTEKFQPKMENPLIPVNLSPTIRPYLSRKRDQIDPEHTNWFTVAVCSGCSLSARDCVHNEGCEHIINHILVYCRI